MNKLIFITAALIALAFIPGCGTPATYTDPANAKTAVVNLDKINVQDWETAADQMIQSLLAAQVLDKAPVQPAILAMDRIVNKTSDANLDTDLLEKKIRIALNRSGKCQTTTTYGPKAESQIAKDAQDRAAFLGGNGPVDRSPNYTLTGKIIEDIARVNSTRQVTYIFQLALTDSRTGTAVWEDEKKIQKTGTRAAVGW
jgi:penicillin-binding protein activator